jgi:DNA-binding CsgD family transcriptional regulator/PAS domain-containing protein
MRRYPASRAPQTGAFHRLTSGLQSALTVADVERSYIVNVPGVLPADGHGLYRIDPDNTERDSITTDVTDSFVSKYREYGHLDDPVMDNARAFRRPIDSSRLAKSIRWTETAAYSILADDGYQHSLRSPIDVAGQFCGTVTFGRNRGTRQFDEDDLMLARQLGEQVALALERAQRYEATGHRMSVLEDVLNHLPQGVIVADPDGQPIFTNRAAAAPASRGTRCYAEIVSERVREASEELWQQNRRVSTANVHDPASGQCVVAKSVKLTSPSEASVTLVYPTESDSGSRLPAWDVLTPREQEIAELVSAGLTTKQIAAHAFVSENTVKQHLKRIFAKTDVRNRAELMQRVWVAGGRQQAVPGS